ncbi:hypothetical protein KM043_005101 [Ampulex compressa]|nr:hypothetical protein KM043_005101 [Ampulex compressa]
MGWFAQRASCECNGTSSAPPSPSPAQECCLTSKKALPTCGPVVVAAVKSTCAGRRMFLSSIILILILAALYWMAAANQRGNLTFRPARNAAQASGYVEPVRREVGGEENLD